MPAALYSQSGAGCARCGGPCLANVPAVSYLLCGCSYSRPGIFSVGRRLFPALYTVRYFSRLCILPHAFVLPRTGGGVTVSCGQVCFALGQYSWITSFQFFFSARRLRCAVCPGSVPPSSAVFGVPARGTCWPDASFDSIARWNLLVAAFTAGVFSPQVKMRCLS